MTRKRKVLAGVLLVLAAATAIALVVSPAGAHTPATFEFTNGGENTSKITTRSDGSAETAHQVFFIPSVGTITCTSVAYEGTAKGLSETVLRITNMFLNNCQLGKEGVTFSPQECEVTFTATGEMVIALVPGGNACGMTFTMNTSGCVVSITEQTVSGLAYTNITGALENPEVTMTMTVTGTKGTRGAACAAPGSFTGGEIKKGNVIFTGREDNMKQGPIGLRWLATVP